MLAVKHKTYSSFADSGKTKLLLPNEVNEQRVRLLTCGYLRENCRHVIPYDIYPIFLGFVGNASCFTKEQLMTNKEKKELEWNERVENFMNCCLCKAGREWLVRMLMLMILIVIPMLIIAPDIAALIIVGINGCTGTKQVNIVKVQTWILVASITHIIITVFFICFWIGLFRAAEGQNRRWLRTGRGYCNTVTICCGPCLFFIPWTVIGFIMLKEIKTSTENKQCTEIILAWLIIQIIQTLATPFIGCGCFVLVSDIMSGD